MQRALDSFLDLCDLPPDWEAVVSIELLTGCSMCERPLIDITGMQLVPGVGAVRVLDEDTDELIAVYVLCKECLKCKKT